MKTKVEKKKDFKRNFLHLMVGKYQMLCAKIMNCMLLFSSLIFLSVGYNM